MVSTRTMPKDALTANALGEHRLGKREFWVVAALGTAFAVFWSLAFGQDLNWDLRNYQYYTTWAWLHGHVTENVAPAQVQTWLNPLVYLPHYLLMNHLPAVLAGTLFGVFSGINFLLIYVLTRSVLSDPRGLAAIALAFLCAAVGSTAPQFLENLGTTSSDITVSLAVIGALVILCRSFRANITPRKQVLAYFWTGLLLGIACGLKLTCAIYAAGLTLSLLVLWRMLRLKAVHFAAYAAGGVLGFVLTGGYWSWFLWREYGNPAFPYFNDVFRSPWAAADSFRDARFLPQSVAAALAYPFRWFAGENPAGEAPLRDARFALLFVLLTVTLITAAVRRVAHRGGLEQQSKADLLIAPQFSWLFVLFSITSYTLWLKMFAIHRYLIPLALLSGLVLLLTMARLLVSRARLIAVFAPVAILCIVWTKCLILERLPYQNDWFGLEIPAAASEPNTLFVMLKGEAESYVIPFLPPSSRFIRIAGNFPLQPGAGLGLLAFDKIAQHQGALRSLSVGLLDSNDRRALAGFGLDLDDADCVTFRSRMDEFQSCLLGRITMPQAGLFVEPERQRVIWKSASGVNVRIYVQVDRSPKELFAEGPQGEEQVSWMTPGRRYVFEMLAVEQGKEGALLARVTLDERGAVHAESPPQSTVP